MASRESNSSAWRLNWLDRVGCGRVLVALIVFGFVSHLLFLTIHCPIDLTGDEAHYWDWSRSLDVAYYSKGPLVAWIIRASCAVFGDVMWAVRLPALILAAGTTSCTYWLMRKLFGSSKLALGTVALTHTVPLFVAGSFIMTIDPPFFFCWAVTTCLATVALFDGKRWPWIALGLVAGIGLLAKYAMPLWYAGLFAFLVLDRPSRRWLKTPWPYLALLVTLAFFAAPIWWNAQHDWVTFRHVGRQTGVTQREGAWYTNPPLMLGTQAAILGPILFAFLIAAIGAALRGRVRNEPVATNESRALRYLLCIGGGFFVCIFLASLRAEIEPNWPAPMFFTLVPVAAWWLGKRLQSRESWKPLRGFFWAHVVLGLALATLMHNTHRLYPLAAKYGWKPQRVDIAQIVKARGNAEIGEAVSVALKEHPDAFVLARSYQDASTLSFYVAGQPKVLDIGSHLSATDRTRHSQYDVWPDRSLDQPSLRGRDAIFVGNLDDAGLIRGAFESMEELPTIRIVRGGLTIRTKKLYLARGFKGPSPPEPGTY